MVYKYNVERSQIVSIIERCDTGHMITFLYNRHTVAGKPSHDCLKKGKEMGFKGK